MTTLVILYLFGWTLVFAISTPVNEILKMRIDSTKLPVWLHGRTGNKFAFFAGTTALLSSISFFIWGIVRFPMYVFPICGFSGLVLSRVALIMISPAALVSFGPAFLFLINALLWFSGHNTVFSIGGKLLN
jgi:hypothetical protein